MNKIRIIVDNGPDRLHRDYEFDENTNWDERIKDMINSLNNPIEL